MTNNILLLCVYWNKDFLGDIYGNILAALVAFIIFWLGNRYQKNQENRKEKERLDDLKKYVNDVLPELGIVVEKQAKHLKDFSDLLSKEEEGHYNYNVEVGLHAGRLKWIDQKDLFKIFASGKKKDRVEQIKLLSNVLNKFDYIDQISTNLEKMLQGYFFKHHREYALKYNENATAVSVYKDQLLSDYTRKKKENPAHEPTEFFHDLDGIFAAWGKQPNHLERHVAKKHLWLPLKELSTKYPDAEKSVEIGYCINQCLLSMDNTAVLKEQIKALIDYMVKSLTEAKEQFDLFIKYHNKKDD